MTKELKKPIKKEDIQINLESRQYNGNSYEIGITLYSPFHDTVYALSQESIRQIVIENDLECFTPKITLMYKDINNIYSNGHE